MAEELKYEERLVAYVDIVGWENASEALSPSVLLSVLGSLHQDSTIFNANTRERVRRFEETGKGRANPLFLQVRASAFSDNIVLSMPTSFQGRIFSIGRLCAALLAEGFLVRGAITIGKLYHEDNVVFGPALNRAVALEKSTCFPRIVCEQAVIEHIEKGEHGKDWLEDALVKDDHGIHIVNPYYFPFVPNVAAQEMIDQMFEKEWRLLDTLKHIAANIENFEKIGDEKKLEKWRYMDTHIRKHFFSGYMEWAKKYLLPAGSFSPKLEPIG